MRRGSALRSGASLHQEDYVDVCLDTFKECDAQALFEADSDPEQEWLESNHKARAITAALVFDPEEAS